MANMSSLADKMALMSQVLEKFGKGVTQMQGGPLQAGQQLPAQQGGAPPQVALPAPGGPQAAAPTAPFPQAPPRVPTPSPQYPGGFEFGSKSAARGATVAGAIQGFTQLANTMAERKYQKDKMRYEYLVRMITEGMNSQDPKMRQFAADLIESKEGEKLLKEFLGYKPIPPERPPAAVSALADVVQTQAQKTQSQAGQPWVGAATQSGASAPQATAQPYAGAPQQRGGMPTSVPYSQPPSAEQLASAAQKIVTSAPQELQAPLASFWEASTLFPGNAQATMQAMAKASIDYANDQAAYGHQIALLNMKGQLADHLEMMKEMNRMQLENMKEMFGDKKLDAQRAQWTEENKMRDKQLEAYMDRSEKTYEIAMANLNRKLGEKPLTPHQRLNVNTSKMISGRVINTLEEVLKPENMDVVRSVASSVRARLRESFLGRAVPDWSPSSKDEKRVATLFIRLGEQANVLRAPYGATGFRSREAWEALQRMVSAKTWWSQDPDVTRMTLEEALEDHRRLVGEYNEALSWGQGKPGDKPKVAEPKGDAPKVADPMGLLPPANVK